MPTRTVYLSEDDLPLFDTVLQRSGEESASRFVIKAIGAYDRELALVESRHKAAFKVFDEQQEQEAWIRFAGAALSGMARDIPSWTDPATNTECRSIVGAAALAADFMSRHLRLRNGRLPSPVQEENDDG